MSTRGTCIIRKDGRDKGVYISSDAYPSGFGANVIKIIQTHSDMLLWKLFNDISFDDSGLLEDRYTESFEDAVYNEEHNRPSVFESDSTDFIADSLFCEYAYCINLDMNTLEFYTGYHKPDDPKKDLNRYVKLERVNKDYASCHLAKVYPFSIIRHGDDIEAQKETVKVITDSMEAYGTLISEEDYFNPNVDPVKVAEYRKKRIEEIEKAKEGIEKYEFTIMEWDKDDSSVIPIKNELDIDEVKKAVKTISSNIQYVKPSSQSSAKLAVTCLMDVFGL